MVSNLSSIGFQFESEAAFAETLERLAGEAIHGFSVPAGRLSVWRGRCGAELWFHVTGRQRSDGGLDEAGIVALTPFFTGSAETPVKVTAMLRRPGDNDFEGALTAWVGPDEETGEGAYPVVFDAVDFATHPGRALPFLARVRLVAFARELKAFPDDEAFVAGQQGEAPLAPQAFIPIGLFARTLAANDNDGVEIPPSSNAVFTGRVIEHRVLDNEVTGQPFHWLLVESLETTYDVVADPACVAGDIVPGGTVQVACAMFGRVLA